MAKRPISVIVIGCLFILAGGVGVTYHATEFDPARPFDLNLIGVEILRLLAIVFGIFLMRGKNWARWGMVGWLAFHVVISALHSLQEAATHLFLLAVIAFFLFLPGANAYLRSEPQAP
jgi:hypothetical protein